MGNGQNMTIDANPAYLDDPVRVLYKRKKNSYYVPELTYCVILTAAIFINRDQSAGA